MSCQTKEDFFLSRLKENLTPNEFGDFVSIGMSIFGVGLAAHLAKYGASGQAFSIYNDVKLAVVGSGIGADPDEDGSLAASTIGSFASLAAGAAFVAVAGTSLTVAAPLIGGAVVGYTVGAAAQALFEADYREKNPPTEGCPYGPEEPGGGGFDPDGNEGGGSGSGGGAGFVPRDGGPLNLRWDPLVIDLLGNGLDFISVENSDAQFDLNGDGFRETVGWIGSGTGLIVRDLNDNGAVDGPAELIGNAQIDAYSVLQSLDANGDGFVDALDPAFQQFRVWQDFDQDGVTDAGELQMLAALGIDRLAVSGTTDGSDVAGNLLAFTGTASGPGGASFQTGAVYFTTNLLLSEWEPPAGFEIDPDVFALPNLAGYGTVKDLDAAMTLDTGLRDMVEALVLSTTTASANQFRTDFEAILLRWAGVQDVDPESRGEWVDARHLEVVEAFYGQGFFTTNGVQSSTNPLVDQADRVNEAYDNIVEVMLSRFVSQAAGQHFMLTGDEDALIASPFLALAAAAYSADADLMEGNLRPTLNLLNELAPNSGAERLDYLGLALSTFRGAEGEYLGYAPGYDQILFEAFDGAESRFTYEFALAVHEADGVGDAIGSGGRDVLWNREDGDLLDGAGGADTYAYTGGNVLIRDAVTFGNSADRLLLDESYTEAAMTARKVGDTVVLTFDGRAGEIRLLNQDSAFDGGLEQIVFADGRVWTRADINAASLQNLTTSGDDVIDGFYRSNDRLDGGAGNDVLSGRSGNDTFVFGRGYGSDLIAELHQTYHNPLNLDGAQDVVAFNADTALSDLTVHILGQDLIIRIDGTADTLTIWQGASGDSWREVEGFSFEGGGFVSLASARALAEPVVTRTISSEASTTVALEAGDERVVGRGGVAEVYEYARVDGFDVIASSGLAGTEARDTVRLVDVNSTEVRFLRTGSSFEDLVIEIGGTGGARLVIEDQFYDSGFGHTYGVQSIEFADGVVLSLEQIVEQMIDASQTAGADIVRGSLGADQLEGGRGDDQLSGGRGGDTYVWRSGDGHDAISDVSPRSEVGQDVLRVTGVDPSAVTVARGELFGGPAGSIRLSFGPEGSVMLLDQTSGAIERVVFDNGVVWDASELVLRADSGFGDDVTHPGTSGADTLAGTSGADVLDGAAGADVLQGGDGSDLYLFGVGSGSDLIRDQGDHPSISADGIRLIDLNPSDVELGRTSDDLFIRILSTGETLTVDEHFGTLNATTSTNSVERILFGSGEVWDLARINAEGDVYRGTSGDDDITAFGGGDNVFIGGTGNDLLQDWYGGDDTYRWSPGDGDDVIVEANGFDTLRLFEVDPAQVALLRDGRDLVIVVEATGERITIDRHFDTTSGNRRWAIEVIAFDNGISWNAEDIADRTLILGTVGDDWLNGSAGNDVLEGLEGADRLNGQEGSDAYIWSLGDGDDRIAEQGSGSDVDTLRLLDVNLEEVAFDRVGDDLEITILASGERITVEGHFWVLQPGMEGDPTTSHGIERIEFADGVLDQDGIRQRLPSTAVIEGTAGDDYLLGDEQANAILGLAGHDLLEGFGGADTLNGGTGDDSLYGGEGSDLYVYDAGGGYDFIWEDGGNADEDHLDLGAFARSDVSLAVDRSGLTLTTSAGEVVLGRQFAFALGYGAEDGAGVGIERVSFADDPDVDVTTLLAAALGANGMAVQTGSSSADTLTGTSGSDALAGLSGDDSLVGGTGNDRLFGGEGGDTLTGGAGDDELVGGVGLDLYVYDSGDGNDVLFEVDGADDVLRLGSGLSENDVTVTRVNDDAVLVFADGGSVTLLEQFAGYGVGTVEFDGGVSWTRDDLYAQYLASAGTPGSDIIYGSDGADTITGRGGDDTLMGGEGADTYVFSAEPGFAIVDDWGGSDTDVDRVVLTDIASDDIVVRRDTDDPSTMIIVVGADQEIRLQGTMGRDPLTPGSGIDEIAFSDAVTWTRQELADAYLSGLATAGDDRVEGFFWDDNLSGGAGNDTFVFGFDFGQDRVEDFSLADDRLEVWAYNTFADVMADATQVGDDVVIDLGYESITLVGMNLADLNADHFILGGPQSASLDLPLVLPDLENGSKLDYGEPLVLGRPSEIDRPEFADARSWMSWESRELLSWQSDWVL